MRANGGLFIIFGLVARLPAFIKDLGVKITNTSPLQSVLVTTRLSVAILINSSHYFG